MAQSMPAHTVSILQFFLQISYWRQTWEDTVPLYHLYHDFYTEETLNCNPDVNRTKMSHKNVNLHRQETRSIKHVMAL